MSPSLIFLVAAMLQYAPTYSVGDPRIQTVPYDSDQVVRLAIADGYATLVELSPDERIETVVVGNSAVWQVTAGRQGDRLAVKPLAGATATNMTVVTDLRQYVFVLESTPTVQGTPFVVRFTYAASSTASASANLSPKGATSIVPQPGRFRLSGARELRPRAISDDGKRTTVVWDAAAPLPATFSVDRRGREQLVNGRMVGDRYVIEGVAPRYVFRLGKRRAAARRDVAPQGS